MSEGSPGAGEQPASWKSPLILSFSLVTNGVSQAFFRVVMSQRDCFPLGGRFLLWILLWLQAFPILLLFGADRLVARTSRKGRVFAAWRAFLYAAPLLCFARLVEVTFWKTAGQANWLWPLVVALVWLFCLRFRRAMGGFFAWLAIVGILLTGWFAYKYLEGIPLPTRTPPPAEAPSASPSVYVVVLDELALDILRDGEAIDAKRFPNLAALSHDAAWYPEAWTNQGWTVESTRSFLRGASRPDVELPIVFDRLPADCEAVVGVSWPWVENWIRQETRVDRPTAYVGKDELLEDNPWLSAHYLATVSVWPLGKPLRRRLYPRLGHPYHVGVGREVDAMLREMTRPRATPRFIYWHVSVPHEPFLLASDGSLSGGIDSSFHDAPLDAEAVLAQYRAQVQYADRIVGSVVEALRSAGLYEDTFLIVTSDHGLHTFGYLEPKGYPEVRSDWTPRIPFFLHGPGVPPGPQQAQYQHIDLVPTILALMGRPATGLAGRPILSGGGNDREVDFIDPSISPRAYHRQGGLWRYLP